MQYIKPVSYTHLDVYKRQILDQLPLPTFEPEQEPLPFLTYA